MNFKKILSLFAGLNVISLCSLSIIGFETNKRAVLEEKNKELTNQLNDILEKNNKYEKNLKLKALDEKSLQNKITQAQVQLQQLNEDLKDKQKLLDNLAIELSNKNNKLEQNKSENKKLLADIEKNQEQLNLSKKELENFQEQKETLLKDFNSKKNNLDILIKEIDELKKEKEILSQNLKTDNETLLAFKKEYQNVQEQKETILKDINNKQKLIESKQKEISVIEKQFLIAKNELDQKNNNLQEKQQQLNDLTHKIEEKTNELINLEKQNKTLIANNQDLLNNVAKRNKDINSKEQDFKNLQKAIEMKNNELQEINNELKEQKNNLIIARAQENLIENVYPAISRTKKSIEDLKINKSDFFKSKDFKEKLNQIINELKYVYNYFDFLEKLSKNNNNKFENEIQKIRLDYDDLITTLVDCMFWFEVSNNNFIIKAPDMNEAAIEKFIDNLVSNIWNSIKETYFKSEQNLLQEEQLPEFKYYINIIMNNNGSLSAASFKYHFEKGQAKTQALDKKLITHQDLSPDMTDLEERYQKLANSDYLNLLNRQ